MIHAVVKNIVRENTEGQRFIGNVYLTSAVDIESGHSVPNMKTIDVRGFIDHRYSRVDNIYGCLKIAQEIEDALRNGKNPVVFCDGGMERSPLAVAVWLSWVDMIHIDVAYTLIKAHKGDIHRREEWVKE